MSKSSMAAFAFIQQEVKPLVCSLGQKALSFFGQEVHAHIYSAKRE